MNKPYFKLIGLLLLVACSSPQPAPTTATPHKGSISASQPTSAYWTAQPFCIGRYRVNLPANRKGATSNIFYNDWQIDVRPDYWRMRIEDILDVKKTGYDGSHLFVEKRTIIPDKAILDVTRNNFDWDGNYVQKYGMPYTNHLNFKLNQNDVYIVSGFFHIKSPNDQAPANWKAQEKAKIDEIVGHYKRELLNGLRDRADNDIPTRPGVCLNGGFIADSGQEPFWARASIRLEDYNDVYAAFITSKLNPDTKPLLQRKFTRRSNGLGKILPFAQYSTIRQGPRNINGIAGNEKLVKWQGKRYLFMWEPLDRSVHFRMAFGTSSKNSNGSPLSEKEAIAAWDTILPTLKKHN